MPARLQISAGNVISLYSDATSQFDSLSSNFAFEIVPACTCLLSAHTSIISNIIIYFLSTRRTGVSFCSFDLIKLQATNKSVKSQESDYDDVGPPTTYREAEGLAVDDVDCEEIYDDVMLPDSRQDCPNQAVREGDYLVPERIREESTSGKESIVELRVRDRATAETTTTTNDDQYFSTNNNEYSSVDCESYLDEEKRDEMGVYDDVGMPHSEERVNSLYAGSTPGSVLGLTSINGKESEWEDLEEVSSASRCPCQTNDAW